MHDPVGLYDCHDPVIENVLRTGTHVFLYERVVTGVLNDGIGLLNPRPALKVSLPLRKMLASIP